MPSIKDSKRRLAKKMDTERLNVVIDADVSGLEQGIADAQGALQEVSQTVEKTKGSFGSTMGAIGKATATAMKAAGAAIAAGATALVGLAETTRDYRTEQAKLISGFEASGISADTAKQTYNELYRVMGESDTAAEAANHLAKLTTNQEELSEWTKICEGVYATFGDSLPIEGLTEAANETAKVGQVTGPLADALNWVTLSSEEATRAFGDNKLALVVFNDAIKEGMSQEDAFNEALKVCNTEAQREAIIRGALNEMYDDAAIAYEKNAADILAANEAQSKLNDAMAEAGTVSEVINTVLKTTGAELLQTLVPGLRTTAEALKNISAGIEGAGQQLSNGIATMVND